MPKIQVVKGSFDKTCTVEKNLTENQAARPEISEIIEYVEPRMLSTLLVSGAMAPWVLKGAEAFKTKIGNVPADKLIGASGYRYNLMGRIQQAVEIVEQIGTTDPDGTFRLRLKSDYLVPGNMCSFYNREIQARLQGECIMDSDGTFIGTFQDPRVLFDFNVHVAPPGQSGPKYVYGGYTAYPSGSKRGYGRSHYPDQFINHLGIQRKRLEWDGDALTTVLWVHFGKSKGWMFEKERQARIQFRMEDEYNKWFAKSTMRDPLTGALLNESILKDEEGKPVIIGDGVEEQIRGINDVIGSGVDGLPTIEDFEDMMVYLEKKSNAVSGKYWCVVTGTDGYVHAQRVLRDAFFRGSVGQGRNVVMQGKGGVGGQDIEIGNNFDTLNFASNQIRFVKHTMFDDEQKFFARTIDGRLAQSCTYYFLDMGINQDRARNVEILSKGAYGINRSMVSSYFNGLTGYMKESVNSIDGLAFDMLKHDGIFIYNTASCGIMYPRLF